MKFLQAIITATFAAVSLQAGAAVFTGSGQIVNYMAGAIDNDNGAIIGRLDFTVDTAGMVTISSDNTGIDSYIMLFDSSDAQLAVNDNDPSYHGSLFDDAAYDSGMEFYLAADSYFVTIGAGSYNITDALQGFMSNVDAADTIFNDYGSASWQLQAVTPSPVPVPAALPLFISALAGLGWLRRR